jgi:hypothetical protein
MARRPVQYDLSDYRDDGTLRVSALIITMTLFLSRHLLLIFMGGISTFKGAKVSGISGLYSQPLLLLASIPALLVLVAMFRRIAKGGALPRAIWTAGRWLLCLAAALDTVLALVLADFRADRISAIQIAVMIADAYIVVYLLRSERARDTFADFPAPRVQASRGQDDSGTRE